MLMIVMHDYSRFDAKTMGDHERNVGKRNKCCSGSTKVLLGGTARARAMVSVKAG